MAGWQKWGDVEPEPGSKIVIACSDGCSTAAAFVIWEEDRLQALHAEDGYSLDAGFLLNAIWSELPRNYPIAFMEVSDDVEH